MTATFSLYFGVLLLSLIVLLMLLIRRCGLRTAGVFFFSASLSGFVLSRANAMLFGGFGRMSGGFFSLDPLHHSFFGFVLGACLGLLVTGSLLHQSPQALSRQAAAPLLLFLALARFCEFFADFGWGQITEGFLSVFPLSVKDMYGLPHLSVFLLEGLFALILCFSFRHRTRASSQPFIESLCLVSAAQIFFESLRTEPLMKGFVKVQQIEFLLLILALALLLHICSLRFYIAFVLCIAVSAFCEYALDKLPSIPVPVLYGLMVASLIWMTYCFKRFLRIPLASGQMM